MTEFKPPISERETEELIEIAHSTTDEWSQEAITQAKKELSVRKISEFEQYKIIEKWKNEYNEYVQEFEKEEKIRLKSNETESYKVHQMILLFIFGPIIFMRPQWYSYDTIFDLKRENFKLKFKQRIIILSLSFICWFLYIKYDIDKSEKLRMEEIEKIDISDWEKKHGYD